MKPEVACVGELYYNGVPVHMQHWNLFPGARISNILRSCNQETYDDSKLVEVFYLAISFPCLQNVVPKLRHPDFLTVLQVRRLQT